VGKLVQAWALKLTSRNDLALAFLLVAVIFMIVLPMPTILVDAFIAINISAAVVLLMVAVYLPHPLAFSAFPSVLLLTTLFRLALSITTTRLILLEADAGKIIYAFGDFVIAGNLVVGLVIFLIITLVQFIVITKGSERVAEVSARFSLDAMPGKQMSIDSDLRAGVVTMEQAKERRTRLEKESQLYGAMDGAMKFVKGDAIAGLIIIIINILGGILVGMMQHGLSAGEALQLYSVLTVGDGLVAQIPAIFIAITAGIIVTRVTTEEHNNLGTDIGNQIMAQPNALLIGGGLSLGMALVPGFPTGVFIILGLVLLGIGWALRQRQSTGDADLFETLHGRDAAAQGEMTVPGDSADPYLSSTPLTLEVAEAMRSELRPELLNAELAKVRRGLYQSLGVPFPGVSLRFESRLNDDGYAIHLQEVPVAEGYLGSQKLFVCHSVDELTLLDIPYSEGEAFLPGLPTVWVNAVHNDKLREKGIGVLNAPQILSHHLACVLRKYASQFVGVQEAHHLLSQLEPGFAELIKEAQRAVPLPKMAAVLRNLVAEDISIRDLRSILEGLVKWGPQEKDDVLLTEYVRSYLKRHISHRFSAGQNILPAYLLNPATEDAIRNGIRQSPTGSYLELEPAVSQGLLNTIREHVGELNHRVNRPVLLTSLDIRRHLRQLIEPDFFELAVLSYQELTPEITVQPLGQIQIA